MRAAAFVLHGAATFFIRRNPIRSCLSCQFLQRRRREATQPNTWSGIRGRSTFGPRADSEWEASAEVPRGWETYGPAWCYVTPQPSPSARRPRCAEPASLSPSPTPLELRHSWLFNLASIPSHVPITTHLHLQIRRNNGNNGGGPHLALFTMGKGKKPGEASGVDLGGKVFGESRLAFVDREGTARGAGLGFIGK